MSRLRSLRFQVGSCCALVLAAGLGAILSFVWLQLSAGLTSVYDAVLEDRAEKYALRFHAVAIASQSGAESVDVRDQLVAIVRAESQDAPPGTIIELREQAQTGYLFRSPPVFASVNIPWPTRTSNGPALGSFRLADAEYRARISSIAAGPRQYELCKAFAFRQSDNVAFPFREYSMVRARTARILLLTIPISILLSALGGYWVSGRALRPVERMIATARSISAENLSSRVTVPDTGDALEHLARTFNHMLDKIERPVRRLSEFTADASHELRTPLAAIQNTAELAIEKPRSEREYRTALTHILEDAHGLSRLLKELLFLARADAGSKLPKEPVNLGDLCAEVAADCLVWAEGKKLTLSCLPAGKESSVSGNPDSLRRLALILVDNAIKHTCAGGQITLSSGVSGEQAFLEVKDTGIGIEPEHLPRIFDRFYRADRSRNRSANSFGLGLSIAKAIAHEHGAVIEVISKPGVGSTFYIRFAAHSGDFVTVAVI